MQNVKEICHTEENVSLKSLCSYRLGGTGRTVCYPQNIQELKTLLQHLKKYGQKFIILGNGTNVVFEDGGVDEFIVCLKKLNSYKINKNQVYAESGVNMFLLNIICRENSLSGLEWSYGIPGSVGGAVYMNAGAYGSEIKDYVKYVFVLRNGKLKKIKNKDMGFNYRKSNAQLNGDIIVGAFFNLKNGDAEAIKNKQFEYLNKRKQTQPYGKWCAGSVFKTINGISAGKVIDKLGLKSVKIGDIEISNKHANFFINLGNGTSKDLHNLIDYVKAEVLTKENIKLEEEIVFIGKRKE